MAYAAFYKEKVVFSKEREFKFEKEAKCTNWSIALYGAETWILWAVDQKCLESS